MNPAYFDTKECEWSDQDILVNGVKVAKARGVKIKKSQEKEELYASGDKPISIQRGNKKYGITLTLLKGAVEDMNRAAIAAGGEDINDVEVVIVVNFRARGNRLLQTYTCISVQFTEFEIGLMQNDKFQEVSLPCLALDVKHN